MNKSGLQSPAVAEDLDTLLEEAWTRLYAKMDAVAPLFPPLSTERQSEQQAMAIIKTLASELATAGKALESLAETLKMRPDVHTHRLSLANMAIKASRRAREAAQSVLG